MKRIFSSRNLSSPYAPAAVSSAVLLLAVSFSTIGCSSNNEPPAENSDSSTEGGAGASGGSESAPDGMSDVGGADCLVGEWLLPEEEVQAFYDALAEPGQEGIFLVDGDITMSFTETDFTYSPEFDLTMDGEGVMGSGVTTGSITGAYSTEGNVLMTNNTASTVEMSLIINGMEWDTSALMDQFVERTPLNESPYTCQGDLLIVESEGAEGEGRVPLEFERQ